MYANLNGKRIGLYKPLGIGDGLFGLIVSSLLKKKIPDSTIIYLGIDYPETLLKNHHSIDHYYVLPRGKKPSSELRVKLQALNLDIIIFAYSNRYFMKLAKELKIPVRVGFGDKIYTYLYCNHWTSFWTTKKTFKYHHNIHNDLLLYKKFDRMLEIDSKKIIEAISYKSEVDENKDFSLSKDKFKLIIHPGGATGKSRTWSAKHYRQLINLLDVDKFQVILTGGPQEMALCDAIKSQRKDILNFSGKLSLEELKALILQADGLIAASTGPLHLSAFLGKHTLGIFPSFGAESAIKWGPVGKKALAVALHKKCTRAICKQAMPLCHCIASIPVIDIKEIMETWEKGENIEQLISSTSSKLNFWYAPNDLMKHFK